MKILKVGIMAIVVILAVTLLTLRVTVSNRNTLTWTNSALTT